MVVFSKNALGIGTAVRTDVWHRDCSDFFFPDERPKDAGHLTHPIKKKKNPRQLRMGFGSVGRCCPAARFVPRPGAASRRPGTWTNRRLGCAEEEGIFVCCCSTNNGYPKVPKAAVPSRGWRALRCKPPCYPPAGPNPAFPGQRSPLSPDFAENCGRIRS